MKGDAEQVIVLGIRLDPADISLLLEFRAPKVAIAELQASLLVHIAQSSPSKPDVHCDVPVQPVLCALLDSAVRFAGVAMGFPHRREPQSLPLQTMTDETARRRR